MSARAKRRVLLVGWDAADWKVIRPLLAAGDLPHLAGLVRGGASGNLSTLRPILSPMLWTSIATGKRPPKHGILGFVEPSPDGTSVRPVTSLGRTCKALWNILGESGLRSAVVGWWPSHPVERIDGVMVSNFYSRCGEGPLPKPMAPGTVHPPDWQARLAELRVTPMEIAAEMLRLFVPHLERVDQSVDTRLHSLAKIVAETMSIHAAATEILEHADWDFAAIYYDAIDHLCHGFMSFHPPRMPRIGEAEFETYRGVVANGYRYHDAMLGRLLELAGSETTVIVMSDHGFHPDHLRPTYIPAEAAGPAVEHRPFGIVCMRGPDLAPGATIQGASVLDITPTILHLLGLPVGDDMDGTVISTAFSHAPAVQRIATWETSAGPRGDAERTPVDPLASAEALKQLVDLGYVDPPDPDKQRDVDTCVRELKLNLAMALDDSMELQRAVAIYEDLLATDRSDHRWVSRLVEDLVLLGQDQRALAILDDFTRLCEERAPVAIAELGKRRAERPDHQLRPGRQPGDRREVTERRRLVEQATGFVAARAALRALISTIDGRRRACSELLDRFEKSSAADRDRIPPLLMASVCLRAGRSRAAIPWLERALERDPEDSEALALLTRACLRGKRYEDAARTAERSLALVFRQPGVHFLLGMALLGLGDTAASERELLVAVGQLPGMIPAHRALARLYRRHLARPADAARHDARARELRATMAARRAAQQR